METELEHLFGLLMFLGHEPFCNRRAWADYIVRPIRKGVAAAEQRLLDILSQVMIKNKQEDIDKEIALPECHTSGTVSCVVCRVCVSVHNVLMATIVQWCS
mgnify:CR=1 FL=1